MVRRSVLSLCVLLGLLASASTSHAYFSTIDTGEMVPKGKYQVSVEPQIIFNEFDGFNVVGRFDTGINADSSARVLLGVGKVDYQVGGFYKYVPFPDTSNQPAIGGSVGMVLARANGVTMTSIRFQPLVSKKFETEIGDLIPYASLPLGITFTTNQTTMPVQLVVGSELRPLNMKDLSFFAELGLNVTKAFGYVSGAIAYRF
ncbi:MAG: hypothetical protein AAB250_13330 [Bdellovibrionota bacterium]